METGEELVTSKSAVSDREEEDDEEEVDINARFGKIISR